MLASDGRLGTALPVQPVFMVGHKQLKKITYTNNYWRFCFWDNNECRAIEGAPKTAGAKIPEDRCELCNIIKLGVQVSNFSSDHWGFSCITWHFPSCTVNGYMLLKPHLYQNSRISLSSWLKEVHPWSWKQLGTQLFLKSRKEAPEPFSAVATYTC